MKNISVLCFFLSSGNCDMNRVSFQRHNSRVSSYCALAAYKTYPIASKLVVCDPNQIQHVTFTYNETKEQLYQFPSIIFFFFALIELRSAIGQQIDPPCMLDLMLNQQIHIHELKSLVFSNYMNPETSEKK